ncbi:hypothetical protein EMIHUDRAFT_102628 [Emiliania huxleyi CCMP1516]|uniref:J domain-containing protein n=2 Tax=Emiliania huxleyi TaxID=2903 RepID=A0A0D3J1K2_EMIH1|nr:hypothetical protein EMIHUDRAFT_245415 [Emiliania huxleyi CCMP1516]XP_005769816.1 hypothetical protein EMIHUDRAFT_102628 [Emiliania huxleyi CCMP1516]EOD16072.1 hypothetical protein EMIHUDRAFT_245415 [Emiliania huxleyi CCMP1516]EOD17387.1 hypothetical protein EMIHUDRAFT_102628 [Emiliania huxleyi CCMP1516]|eukprot:XP_005768501.1 hypothetical protein EMIHUDRAFT_245415 [Emiliania huxleyi CCMP1516]
MNDPSRATSSSGGVIRAILRGANHFEILDLPKPYPDLVGEAAWDAGADDVNRAFRKRSLHCHPDKSRHPDAPRAFDLLKKAKACLLSDLEREAYIRDHVKMQQTLWEGSWKSDREAAEARERIASARCNAQEEQTALVVDAMKRRRDKAQSAERKKQRSALRAQASSARRVADDEPEEEEEGGPEPRSKPAPARKQRPRFF